MRGKFIPGPWEISEQKERPINSMVWNPLKLFSAEGRRRAEPARELLQIGASQPFFTSCVELFQAATEGKGGGCFRLQAVGPGVLAVLGSAPQPKVLRE